MLMLDEILAILDIIGARCLANRYSFLSHGGDMGRLSSIPIIFGVTGHRDLRDEDIVSLEASVRELLASYQTKYPHTELIVISALAEGADMLVARVAVELGLTLHVLIPYQEEEYLNSFADRDNNEAEYRRLKGAASRFEVHSCVHTHGAESCYQQLGERIADVSTILIALWDGVDNGKRGGTAAIVRYQRAGFEENRFDAMDGNALFVITTPRISHPDVQTDFSVEREYLGKFVKGEAFEAMLSKIDALNAETGTIAHTDGSVLQAYMNYFEATAGANQKRFKTISVLILVLTALAFASMEMMHVMHWDFMTWGYGVGLLLAFDLYWFFMKNGKVQDDFVYSRGFAEAIRVQNAWNGAKLGKSVARYHLKDQHHKFTWLKTVLKNLDYIDKDKEPFTPAYDKGSTPHDWIDGQIEYFTDALKKRHGKHLLWERIETWLYKVGLVSLVLMFVVFALESLHLVHHGALWFNWHYLVLVSGLLLMVAAFIGEKYMKIAGFEEEIYHFNAMLSDFKEAKKALTDVTEGSDAYRKIIYDLGRKALDENSKWVVLHDSMRAKPSLE